MAMPRSFVPCVAIVLTGITMSLNIECRAALGDQSVDTSFTVGMHSGGCTLTVERDGGGHITYGSMPKFVHVSPGTFEFAALLAHFRRHAVEQSAVDPRSDSLGEVLLPESGGVVRYYRDTTFIRELLDKGWRSRLAPRKGLGAREDHEWVARACKLT
jgi:hypothetical protein